MPTPNPLSEHHFIPHWSSTANPAAGAVGVISRPGASHVELHHLSFSLTADANAATRVVWISLNSGAEVFPLGEADFGQDAASVWPYTTTHHPPGRFATLGNLYYVSLVSLRSFDPADTWNIQIQNIQVGDQISLIRAHWKLWRGLT